MHTTFPASSPSTRVIRLPAALVITISLLLMPLAPMEAAAQDDDPLQVIASFSVLADIVRQVGGDHAEVSSLVPVGGDAHTFAPSPDTVAAIAGADLIIAVGNGFEPWLDDLVQASGSDAPRLAAFEGNDDDSNGLHVWLDVRSTEQAVARIADQLAAIDADHADAYAASADAYTAKLDELDTAIINQTATLPEEQRQLVTSHESFDVFANAYGYEIAGVLLESHSTEGADASARHVAELVGIIEQKDISAVFPDSPAGAGMLQPVADEAGVDIAPQLYVDTLGDEGSDAETYVGMMRHDVDTIVTALGDA